MVLKRLGGCSTASAILHWLTVEEAAGAGMSAGENVCGVSLSWKLIIMKISEEA